MYTIPASGGVPTAGGPCELVYGQHGSFTTGVANDGGISSRSLYFPDKTAVDHTGMGNLYAADFFNSRVLFFPHGNTTATKVWGQGATGNQFSTNAPNCGGAISASCFNFAASVAVDSAGDLYVGDWFNGRVLYFPSGQFTATRVYGAADLVTAGGGAASQTSIYGPADLALDKAGDLWVVDQGHNRVLEFPAGCIGSPCMASRVIGQASWTADAAGTSPTATSLDEPSGLAFDGGGGLYVMDTSANRVLFFDTATCGTFDCAASRVYGQSSFTTNTAGTTATTLSSPGAAVVDTAGALYVSDGGNRRVLYFAPSCSGTPCSATRVYGHNGSYTCGVSDDNGSCVSGGPSAVNLGGPSQVSLDKRGDLYVVDAANSRMLMYSTR